MFELPFEITPAICIFNTVIDNIYVSPGNCIEQNYQYYNKRKDLRFILTPSRETNKKLPRDKKKTTKGVQHDISKTVQRILFTVA